MSPDWQFDPKLDASTKTWPSQALDEPVAKWFHDTYAKLRDRLDKDSNNRTDLFVLGVRHLTYRQTSDAHPRIKRCMSDGVAESTENTKPRDSSKGSKKDVWEVVESVSRVFPTLAIPVILAGRGWVIQLTVSQQTVSKDYVSLATSILQKKREQDDDESAKGLRKWAVDLLNRTSPVQLDGETAQRLAYAL